MNFWIARDNTNNDFLGVYIKRPDWDFPTGQWGGVDCIFSCNKVNGNEPFIERLFGIIPKPGEAVLCASQGRVEIIDKINVQTVSGQYADIF